MILKIFWSKKNKVISYVCVFVGGGGGGRGGEGGREGERLQNSALPIPRSLNLPQWAATILPQFTNRGGLTNIH